MIKIRFCAVVVVALAASVSACGHSVDQSAGAASTTTELAEPYPMLWFYTDVAVPLEPRASTAAEFALHMFSRTEEILGEETTDATKDSYMGLVLPESVENFTPWVNPPNFVAKTGGRRVRVVAARELDYGTVEVSICSFNSPGEYTVFAGGRVIGPSEADPYQFSRPVVKYTDRPAADGSQPGFMRWLWADRGSDPTLSSEKASICEPFKPDPFIQEMPELKPTRTPATTRPGPSR